MANQNVQYEDREEALRQVQGELLEALLNPEDYYPWNPADPETETYFVELESNFDLELEQNEQEISEATQSLFGQLQRCWTPAVPSVDEQLQSSLAEKFQALVPQERLEAIANAARRVFSTNVSLADQLVLCVKPLLSNWAEDDLLVLARPWAYAMRSTSETAKEGIPGWVRTVEWQNLSPVEQARLSLAVAHSAIVELNKEQGKPEQP
ncbi:MAG: hypothetical protein WA919_00970 [Coleofasciculaceae cyanobacterium]